MSILAFILSLTACGVGEKGVPGEEVPEEFQAVRSTTFGAEEGEGALANVWGVAVSDDGRLFASEPSFARVVEFNSDGTFSRVLGGEGDGPGEFRIPGALSWRGDSLAVTDFQRGIHLFSPDGRFADLISFTVDDGSSPFGVRPVLPLADGSVAAVGPAPNMAIVQGAVTHEIWLRASRDGEITDTLVVLSLDGRLYSASLGEASRSGAHPLAWAPLLTASPTGESLIVVDRAPAATDEQATYRVLLVGLDGDTIDMAEFPYSPRPLLGTHIDSISTAMARGWAQRINAAEPSAKAAIKEQIDWPEYQPPVTEVLAGADGSIWVRRETIGTRSARWEVLDQDLGRIGSVQLPLDLDLKVVAKSRAYGVELDEFDVPNVVRFDLHAPN